MLYFDGITDPQLLHDYEEVDKIILLKKIIVLGQRKLFYNFHYLGNVEILDFRVHFLHRAYTCEILLLLCRYTAVCF